MKILDLDYYYGIEAEQFSFYRIPRLIIKGEQFKCLSSDSKLLYGLMLDRMALSMQNGWLDEKNRVYIHYTLEEIMEDLGCAREKAAKVLAELDSKKGIGLIEKKRQGLGKPDIIYVKNFATLSYDDNGSDEPEQEDKKVKVPENSLEEPASPDFFTEVRFSNFKKTENRTSRSSEMELFEKCKDEKMSESFLKEPASPDFFTEVGKSNFKKSENRTSRSRKIELQEVRKSNSKYNNNNYNNIYPSIYLSNTKQEDGRMDHEIVDKRVEKYRRYLWKNLECDIYGREDEPDAEMYLELYEIICDIVSIPRPVLRIEGTDVPYDAVKAQFIKLNPFHLKFVIDSIKNKVTPIKNIKNYVITALYNAAKTIEMSFTNRVNSDMQQGFGGFGVAGAGG